MEKLHLLTDEEFRKVQLEELEILKYVTNFCKRNNISYFLDWGTLLGAVRHHGFIPWDNDIDIGMLRKDYEKFCDSFVKEGNEDYVLQNWHTDKNWPLSYSKVRKKNTIYITNHVENNQNEDFCGFDIDVFVYDDISEDSRALIEMNRGLKKIQRILLMKAGYRPWYLGDRYSVLKRLFYLPFQFLSLFYSKENLIHLYEDKAKTYAGENGVFCHAGTYNIQLFEKDVLSDLGEFAFEGEVFNGPKDYDKILSLQYGDYMELPPLEARKQRSYALKVLFS